MVKPRIESDQLNEIYTRWRQIHGFSDRWYNHFDHTNLRYHPGKGFDEFVWKSGGHIRQEHGKRYAEFFDEHDMIMFSLKYL
jgi:hypothetical protein